MVENYSENKWKMKIMRLRYDLNYDTNTTDYVFFQYIITSISKSNSDIYYIHVLLGAGTIFRYFAFPEHSQELQIEIS